MRDRGLPDPNGRPQAMDAGCGVIECIATVAAALVISVLMLAGFPIRMAGATRSTRLKIQERQQQAADAAALDHGARR